MSFVKFGDSVAHIMEAGPTRKISVGGKIYIFEMHRYCGPVLLTKKGEPAAKQPAKFLEAASLWAQQGQRMEGDLCRWDWPSEPIIEHIFGRHYRVTGYTQPRRGE